MVLVKTRTGEYSRYSGKQSLRWSGPSIGKDMRHSVRLEFESQVMYRVIDEKSCRAVTTEP
jgi:hypothetical protein